MRYFLAKDAGSVVREKQVFSGDQSQADSLVASYLAKRPGWTAQEVDQPTFDATAAVVDQTISRDVAIADITAAGDPGFKIDRAAAAYWMVRFNDLRQQIAGIRNAISTGGTFADVKTAVNALPPMPPALVGQDVKDGIKANLQNGTGD